MQPKQVPSLVINAEDRIEENMNQLVLVGRLQEINKEGGYIILKQTTTYKNVDGVYEDYTNKILLFGEVLNNLVEYCKINDIIGVKGRIENNIIKGEKITFLSSKKED